MENEEIRISKAGNKVYFAVENLPQFRELVERAKEQAHQLERTINEHDNFNLEIDFSIKNHQ